MYFIDQIAAIISKNSGRSSQYGDYYFERESISAEWAKPWLGHFPASIMSDAKNHFYPYSLGQLTATNAIKAASDGDMRLWKMVFLLELAELNKGGDVCAAGDQTSVPYLDGYLAFLLALSGKRKWLAKAQSDIEIHEIWLSAESSYAQVVEEWFSVWNPSQPEQSLMLAKKPEDVAHLNRLAREVFGSQNILHNPIYVKTIYGKKEIDKEFAEGDRIVFKRSSGALGVKSGQRGTVTQISSDLHGKTLRVRLDAGQEVSFAPEEYAYIDYGYAVIGSNVELSRNATRFVNEELAESYMRLLAAYWRTVDSQVLAESNLPESIEKLFMVIEADTEIAKEYCQAYTRKRGEFRKWLNGLSIPACEYEKKFLKGFGLGGKRLDIDLGFFRSIDKLFFRERQNDLRWLKENATQPRSNATADKSEVYNYCDTRKRQLDGQLGSNFPVTLLLILILERVIYEGNMKPPIESGREAIENTTPHSSEAAAARDRKRVAKGDFISPAAELIYMEHKSHCMAQQVLTRARNVRYAGTLDPKPAYTSGATEMGKASAGSPSWIIRHHGEGVRILQESLTVLAEEDDDDYDEYDLRGGDTLEIDVLRETWNQANFGVQSFVYWVTESDWERYYIPHRQVCAPGLDMTKIYLELDEYCLDMFRDCDPPLFLQTPTKITTCIDADEGVLQLFVMMT